MTIARFKRPTAAEWMNMSDDEIRMAMAINDFFPIDFGAIFEVAQVHFCGSACTSHFECARVRESEAFNRRLQERRTTR